MRMADLFPPDSCKVYTPRPIADAMIRALQPDVDALWLEPSVGQGVFLSALSGIGIAQNKIVAVDLDPVESEADSLAITHRGLDFLTWFRRRRRRFDRIVGNPPYIPFSRLDQRLKETAAAVRIPGINQTVPSTSNTWLAFLCGCVHVLEDGGNLALILPAAWDFADYASSLRENLPSLFREFFTFRSRRPLFKDVQEGSIVIVGRGYRHQHQSSRRIECSGKDDLISRMLRVCTSEQHSDIGTEARNSWSGAGAPLRDLVEIRLGGVTGHVEFFLLTEDQRLGLGLPLEAVLPVLSRSHHLTGAAVNRRSWDDLLRRGERVWLLRPTGDLPSLPEVANYLSRPYKSGGCDRRRYKIRKRNPWYLTPVPERVDGFMSGMTRNGPWISLKRTRSLNATNTLYVVSFKEKLNLESKFAICLAMLTSCVRSEIRKRCRHYADGLMKHEPGDLLPIKIPLAKDSRGAMEAYSQAITYLLAGKSKDAAILADRFFDA
jgi:adenine-specific DNA-methyltransferase